MRAIIPLLCLPLLAFAAPAQKRAEGADACAFIATQVLNDPHDVLSCLKSFPFREELRQNVMAVAESVINFYTYETTAIASPPPFEDTSVNLRQEFDRIRTQHYDTDYDFNLDLYFTVNRLNDGHTIWIPNCYINVFQNILPIPIVSLARKIDPASYPTAPSEAIYVIPDANDFFAPFLNGSFHKYFEDKGIDVKRFEGAEITCINGQDPYSYVSQIADEYSGSFLDRQIRQSMSYSSYRFADGWTQRLGNFAGPIVPNYPPELEVTVTLIPTDTNIAETITIPYVSAYIGGGLFTDQESFWSSNCAARNSTNGVDYKPYMRPTNGTGATNISDMALYLGHIGESPKREELVAGLPDLNFLRTAIDLPQPFIPTSPNITGTNDVTYFTMLPNTSVGVMMVGSFYSASFVQWRELVVEGILNLRQQGADHLVIDVTNNPGGYVRAHFLLHRLLAGSSVNQNAGFEGAMRANDLARQIMTSNIDLAQEYNYGDDSLLIAYYPPGWNTLNGTAYGPADNFMEPPQNLTINGEQDRFSQRTADQCTRWLEDIVELDPPFEFSNIVIVGNGQCASACSHFATVMQELHGVKIANFGAAKSSHSGMSGGIVLEWRVLDSEFKTANLKNHSQAGPDLLVSGNFRHNWRTGYSYRKPDTFLPYAGHVADYTFSYTAETWNNPQALWSFAASEIFGIRPGALSDGNVSSIKEREREN